MKKCFKDSQGYSFILFPINDDGSFGNVGNLPHRILFLREFIMLKSNSNLVGTFIKILENFQVIPGSLVGLEIRIPKTFQTI